MVDNMEDILSFYEKIDNYKLIYEQYQRSEKTIERVLPHIALQKIILLWGQDKNQEVKKQIDTLSEQKSFSKNTFFYLYGLNQEKSEQYKQAIDTYKRITKGKPCYLQSRRQMMHLYRLQGLSDKALEVLNEFLESKELPWQKYMFAAQLYEDLGQLENAILILKKGYQNYPQKTQLLYLKGIYQDKNKKIVDTIKTLQEVIKQDPLHSDAFNYLGYIYAEQGENLNIAEELLLHSLTIEPKNPHYLDSLAWIYYKQGNYKKSITLLLQTQKILSKNHNLLSEAKTTVMKHLGVVYRAFLNKHRAKKYDRQELKYLVKENSLIFD